MFEGPMFDYAGNSTEGFEEISLGNSYLMVHANGLPFILYHGKLYGLKSNFDLVSKSVLMHAWTNKDGKLVKEL